MPDSPPKPSRVAVIAIHGVADQQPCDTAQAAADMSAGRANCRREFRSARFWVIPTAPVHAVKIKPGRYQGFEELRLRIAATEPRSGDAAPPRKGAASGETKAFVRRVDALAPQLRTSIAHDQISPSFCDRKRTGARGGRAGSAHSGELSEADSLSLEYMDEQLRDCNPPACEKTYDTIRLESIRTGPSRAHVHVYEMSLGGPVTTRR